MCTVTFTPFIYFIFSEPNKMSRSNNYLIVSLCWPICVELTSLPQWLVLIIATIANKYCCKHLRAPEFHLLQIFPSNMKCTGIPFTAQNLKDIFERSGAVNFLAVKFRISFLFNLCAFPLCKVSIATYHQSKNTTPAGARYT